MPNSSIETETTYENLRKDAHQGRAHRQAAQTLTFVRYCG
jgi:hypothetical protein